MLPEPMIISHYWGVDSEYFLALIKEKKRLVLTKITDLIFSTGQFARINEVDKETGNTTGNFAIVAIIYVLDNAEGLKCDYCILETELICFQYERDGNGD